MKQGNFLKFIQSRDDQFLPHNDKKDSLMHNLSSSSQVTSLGGQQPVAYDALDFVGELQHSDDELHNDNFIPEMRESLESSPKDLDLTLADSKENSKVLDKIFLNKTQSDPLPKQHKFSEQFKASSFPINQNFAEDDIIDEESITNTSTQISYLKELRHEISVTEKDCQ